MALPKDVQDAVDGMFATIYDRDCIGYRRLITIRAHLLSQDAEIERLVGRPVPLTEWQLMQSRLAAADALLREIDVHGVLWREGRLALTTYLQGACDEA